LVMLSTICVATITGLPTALQAATICFWAQVTCERGISTPRSPRATMIPSDSARISSKCASAPAVSILEMILGRGAVASHPKSLAQS
jgi:hypothetical protein